MSNENVFAAISAGDYETTNEGLYVPREKSLVQGIVSYSKRGEPGSVVHNRIVSEGLNYLVAAAVGVIPPISGWYIALFTGDVVVQPTWTASNFATTASEWVDYDEPARPEWERGPVAAAATDSFASKASFTSSVDNAVVRGAALISSSGKGATGGTLMGAVRFPSSKGLDTGEILDVGYGLQISAVS